MSAPLLWIVLPGFLAGLLYMVRRWQRMTTIFGVMIAIGLAWLAWILPIGETISLGPLPFLSSFELDPTLTILGRRFVIDNGIRPVLPLVYLSAALWFGGASIARVTRLFTPLGLGIAALLTAALSVDPFLYAALLIEMAVLVSVPILSPPGRPPGRGVLRFLTFQTMGMLFILFTSWMIRGGELNPGDAALVPLASLLMALGFAFFMAIFPFHTWIPMLSEEVHPYAAAFILFMLPGITSLFALGLFERYTWLRSLPVIFLGLGFVGALMVVIGGVWAAFQRHLGRMMGYAVIVEIGMSLLALSLGLRGDGGILHLEIVFAMFLPRGLSLAIWALALTAIQNCSQGLLFREVQGLGRRLPYATTGLVLAHFSLAGLPLLAGFPVHVALWSTLASQTLPVAVLALFGNTGLLVGAIRTLVVLVMGPSEEKWHSTESWPQRLLLATGGGLLLILGLMPQWFIPALAGVAQLWHTPTP